MCLLLETIKLEHGQLCNLPYHSRRMNASRQELFPLCSPIEPQNELVVPDQCRTGLFRCRVLYRKTIEQVEFIPQQPRTFTHLKIVQHNTIDYHLKLADRSVFNQLLAQHPDADEILIVKNGLLTDCTIGNLVLYDGKNWMTPAHPLLKGTQRQKLLENNQIQPKTIKANELNNYTVLGIINAFFDLTNMPTIKTNNIF